MTANIASNDDTLMNESAEGLRFLHTLNNLLVYHFSLPEEEIVSQGDQSDEFFIISSGDCVVHIKNNKNVLKRAIRILAEGDIIGEIGVVYKCPRSATVESRNYNILAKISAHDYNNFRQEFPGFNDTLEKHISMYNDENKIFYQNAFKRVPYLQNLSKVEFHKVLSKIKQVSYNKGDFIIKEGEETSCFIIVNSGVLHVKTKFEGHEFIIEKLHEGSVFNANTLLTQDVSHVDVVCHKNVVLSVIWEKSLIKALKEAPTLNKRVSAYQNKILLMSKQFPLDYHMVIPRGKLFIFGSRAAVSRRTILKNIVFKRILDVRIHKKKPSI